MPNFKRLQPSDITVTPFKAYKKWNVTVDNQDSSSGYVSLEGINYTSHFYPTEETTPNGLYKRAIYNLVHKLHYKYENDPALTFTNNTREVLEKNYITNAEDVSFPTHESASISHLQFPTNKVGERIKPGTLQITSKSGSLDGEIFKDDSIGNLYSQTVSSSWHTTDSASYWPPTASLKGYWKFDNSTEPYIDYSGNGHTAFHTGSEWTSYFDSDSGLDGLAIKKPIGNSGVRLFEHKELLGQNKQTWALWFKPTGHTDGGNNARIITRDLSEYFGLKEGGDYSTDGKASAVFYFGNGVTKTFTNSLTSGSWHFAAISVDYTEGSQSVYLWNENISANNGWVSESKHTGGIRNWNGSDTGSTANSNKRAVVLGCNSEHQNNIKFKSNNFTGSYDEIRYYDTNLSEQQVHCLKDFPRGSKQSWVGDVWYNQPSAVVKTQGQYKNLALGLGSDGYDLTYDSTVTIYEHEYRCETKEDEFNVTINQSLMDPLTLDSSKVIDIATHSLFVPYVTTIGLYDQNYALLAIGKLAKPIKTSIETPMTFVVRLDF
tara:strand:+ start:6362 stop:8002 length:1641 start_codon:yes stop_codon:yes gene_type:complete